MTNLGIQTYTVSLLDAISEEYISGKLTESILFQFTIQSESYPAEPDVGLDAGVEHHIVETRIQNLPQYKGTYCPELLDPATRDQICMHLGAALLESLYSHVYNSLSYGVIPE